MKLEELNSLINEKPSGVHKYTSAITTDEMIKLGYSILLGSSENGLLISNDGEWVSVIVDGKAITQIASNSLKKACKSL